MNTATRLGAVLGCLLLLPPALGAQESADLAELRAKAAQGDADAQSTLGWRYMTGNGVPEDVREAMNWFRKAAAQDHAVAQTNLCGCYAEVLSIRDPSRDKDPASPIGQIRGSKADVLGAVEWCRKAAERGDRVSQRAIAMLYAKGGEGSRPDYAEAYFWLSVLKTQDAFRDKVAAKLTPEQRAEIQARAVAWKPARTASANPRFP